MTDSKLFGWTHRLSAMGRMILAFAVLVVLLLAFVGQQAAVDHLVVELERAHHDRLRLETAVNALSLEANQLSSLAQVEARAAEELSLDRPSNQQIVQLKFAADPGLPRLALGSLVGEANAQPSGNDR